VFRTGGFSSAGAQKSVRCSLKSNDGLLYPLDKSFMFTHKPTTYIRYVEVDAVEFQRGEGGASGSAARTFDLAVSCKPVGSEPARTYSFSGIDRSERDTLKRFLEERGLRVLESVAATGRAAAVDLAELDDDEDGDEDEGALRGGGWECGQQL
jgi:structure-specific recognition protein 1